MVGLGVTLPSPTPIHKETNLRTRDLVLAKIAEHQTSWETGPDSVLRVSNIGRCLRQSYYIALTPSDPSIPQRYIDTRALWEMEDGSVHEADLIRRLQAAGYVIEGTGENQKEIYLTLPDGYRATGHPDGVIMSGPDIDEPTLFEAKSMSSYSYVEIIKAAFATKPGTRKAEVTDWDSTPDWVAGLRIGHKDYWYQVNAYLLGLGLRQGLMVAKAKDSSGTVKILSSPIDKGLVDGKLHIIRFTADEQVQQEAVDRLWKLRQAILRHEPPNGEYQLANGDWQCRLCPYVEICPNGMG